jgi:hypothetical protein
MASRDFFIRQIEEMGLFLGILFRRILKMKEENQHEQLESVVREALMLELKLDIDQIVVLQNDDFLTVIKEHLTSEDQLEKLADILSVLGSDIGQTFSLAKLIYLQKSLFLFMHLQETSSVFSYERKFKILELQEIIRLKGL